jgi:hypothetical protein
MPEPTGRTGRPYEVDRTGVLLFFAGLAVMVVAAVMLLRFGWQLPLLIILVAGGVSVQAGMRRVPDARARRTKCALAPDGNDEVLAATWDAGYKAAHQYHAQRTEARRVAQRHGISGGLVPNPPDNPYRSTPDWDL